ncbi:MAG: autotransporter outer membrane beta-barrel domain-containing protein [Pseudomonadota bacterium]
MSGEYRSFLGRSRILGLAGLVFASGQVGAGPYGTDSCSSANTAECLNGVSSGVVGGDSLRSSAPAIAHHRSTDERTDGQARARLDGSSGLAAGDGMTGWGLWGSVAGSRFEGDPSFGSDVTRFDGRLVTGLIGADIALGRYVVLGAALGGENLRSDTDFNGGSQDTDGLTLAPYAVFTFGNHFSVDVSAGFSSLDNHQDRIDPTNGSTLNANFDSERWFGAVNANAIFESGRWILGARLGYLYTEESQDSYVETGGPSARSVDDRDLDLSQGQMGVDVGYAFDSFEPYARISYHYDFSRDDGQEVGGLPGDNVRTDFDDDAFYFAAGVRFLHGRNVSGNVEVEQEAGREDFDNTSISVTIRADF